jgi:SAM-dependent methyltransferase
MQPRPPVPPASPSGNLQSPEEPVIESAPLARWIAERLCRSDPATGQSCSWYHGFWQTLRAMDLVTTPAHHAEFFDHAFAMARTHGGPLDVLISGAIDYSMLTHVLRACARHGATPAVTVVDICDTPLFLNRWYARRVGARVRTVSSDILGFHDAAAYDVVCTHSFLGQFSPDARRALMATWHAALKPGGLAITVNRVRHDSGPARTGFSPDQAGALREAVLRKSESLREALELDAESLVRGAEAYAARRRPHPVQSPAEIRDLFENGGFGLEQLSCAPVTGADARVSGPTTPGGALYARIVARRLPDGPSPAASATNARPRPT